MKQSLGIMASPFHSLSKAHVSDFHWYTLNLNHMGKSILKSEFVACPLLSLEKDTFEGGSGDEYLTMKT